MVTRAWIGAAALLALGCTPTLIDGHYSCADGGACPPGWACRRDQTCHVVSNSAPLRAPCESGDECASGACSYRVPGSQDGYCTVECDRDTDCTELGGGARCVASHCLIACSTRDDCPATECQLPHEPMTMTPPSSGSCVSIDAPELNGSRGCPMFMDCPPPAFCIASDDDTTTVGSVGVCSMWCNDDSNCPGGRCVGLLEARSGGTLRHCLRACDPGNPMSCMDHLTCGSLGAGAPEGVSLCIPEGWVGRDLPLPGHIDEPMMRL